jgi:hypothetical protein
MLTTMLLATSLVTTDFVNRVAQVESNHDYNAVGDNGRAVGAWQMWEISWRDTNNSLERKGIPSISWSRRHEPVAQRQMAIYFLLLQEQRLLNNARIAHPTEEQLYLSFSMGFQGFARCGFDPKKVPQVKLRALERLTATK